MQGNLQREFNSDTSLFSVSVSSSFADADFNSETELECLVAIPDTEYRVADKLIFFPGVCIVIYFKGLSANKYISSK